MAACTPLPASGTPESFRPISQPASAASKVRSLLGKVKGRMFRIGHLGDSNDLTLLAALAGCEMGLKLSGVPLAGSGVQAAMDYFAAHPQRSAAVA